MVTETQTRIYNDYLKALAEANNRPYKFRKDFSKLDDDIKTILYRLEQFFARFKHINPYNFFSASLKYKQLKFLSLADYLKQSAIIAYSKWTRAKYDTPIDDERSVDDFMKGLKFIHDYCVAEGITLKDYRTKVNYKGVHQVLIHLNEQKISYYHLHALGLNPEQFNTDYINLVFNDFSTMFNNTKSQYNKSKVIKTITSKLVI